MTRILVTGGAGFIGSQLVRDLTDDANEVLIYDNFSVGRREFLPADTSRYWMVEGDIRDNTCLTGAFESFMPEIVYHLAGIHFIPYCNAYPLETLQVNVEGTQAVLNACQQVGTRRVVLASSAAVYPISDQPCAETDPAAPCDIYGLTKWFLESLALLFHKDTGIPCGIARLFNVFGPRETNSHVIPRIMEQLATTDILALGNVDARRDFVHVEDASSALIAIGHWSALQFEIFNVGTGREYSIREVVDACSRILGRPLAIKTEPSLLRKVDRQHLCADATKIRHVLSWEPRYDLESGLRTLFGG